jgi:hypothetical protein
LAEEEECLLREQQSPDIDVENPVEVFRSNCSEWCEIGYSSVGKQDVGPALKLSDYQIEPVSTDDFCLGCPKRVRRQMPRRSVARGRHFPSAIRESSLLITPQTALEAALRGEACRSCRGIIRSHTDQERINTLFLRIKARLPELEELTRDLEEAEEDGVYRF